MARRWLRWLSPAAVTLGVAGAVTAQVPNPGPTFFGRPITTTAPEPQSTGPGSHGWPNTVSPRPPGYPPEAVPLPAATSLLEAPPSALAGYRPYADEAVLDAEGLTPLPGSLEDNFNREVNARRMFRVCTWNDYRITGFPQTLLWESPYGEKRAPRFQALGTNFSNPAGNKTFDGSIGGTLGLLRVDTPGRDLAFQLDAFAVVMSRMSPNDLIATDYRYGVPLTFQRGNLRGKLSYEHTSSHFGDTFLRATSRLPIRYAKDEVVLGLSRDFDSLRVYGQASYAFRQSLFGDPKRGRFEGGFQYVCPYPTGFSGTPYIAAHATARGELQYNPDGLVQVGVLWRNPYQRLANLRVFVEYYQGRSPFGQFVYDREKWTGVGIASEF